MIPKKIHYCWFGRGKKNELFYKCYDSWKKYFPDFEIIEWNEDNFDISINNYCLEAYNAKKWAFVSDYARLKILYEEGGIYFDTDVEVLKRISDEILETGYFAKECDNKISTGLGFAVYPKNKIIGLMLEDYENTSFLKEDGSYDLKTCPNKNTEALVRQGYIIDKNENNIDGIPIFDKEYFCGWDTYNNIKIVSDKTYTIHHYDASWLPKNKKMKLKLKNSIKRIFGIKLYSKFRNIKSKLKK